VVGEAGDGVEALELAKRLRPDVAIVDIAMPRVNGIEATRLMKKVSPSTAVLVLTAYDYDQYVFALLEAGAAGYLLKDVSGRELIRAVQSVNRGESVLHPTVARKVMRRIRVDSGGPGEEPALTERELQILSMAAEGMKNKEIADRLILSVRTVEAHFGSIFNKLGVGSRTEAVLYALKKGWIALEQLGGGGAV